MYGMFVFMLYSEQENLCDLCERAMQFSGQGYNFTKSNFNEFTTDL